MIEITTPGDVIKALGGRTAVARLVGVVPTAVSNWKKSGRIARSTYPLMTAALRAVGKTAPASLWGMKGADIAGREASANDLPCPL